ncbi:HAMP domain-containing protein [Rhodovulum strictum]|uniref:HAMP domain-containing protein n=1 Tax=Rhodovulum strictum TaxID=58314 RepID=A0A844BL00_9RHOB|nr:HAMP domain-containing protein [Rhodovulum strictum]
MKAIRNTSLRTRIVGGFGLVLMLFAVVTAVGIRQVNQVDAALVEINQVNSVKQRHAINFRGSVHDRAIELRDVVLFDDPARVAQAVETIDRLARDYADSAGPLDALMREDAQTLPREREILSEINAIEARTLPVVAEIIALRRSDEDRAHDLLMQTARPLFIDWLAAINRFIDIQEDKNRVATETATTITSGFQMLMLAACAVSFVIGIAIALWCVASVSRLRALTGVMLRLADGQLQTEVPENATRDEVGDITRTVQVFKNNALRAQHLEGEAEQARLRAEQEKRLAMQRLADEFEASVQGVVTTVAGSAAEMKFSSDTLDQTASDTSLRAAAVATAATEASGNVQTVARATEGLTASIREIAQQVQTSAQTAQGAVAKASQTSQKVAELSEASHHIGEVVELISEIASQTNLLAINASVEAARAGEAGKGFAVVAAEVKNLASQTAKATQDIGRQVAAMQAVTGDTVTAIGEIGATIHELDRIAASIAAAVEQQGAATQDIARNVQEAARGTSEVTANIEAVSVAADGTGSSATELQRAADGLSRLAESLRHEVEGFIGKVRAA